MKNKLKTLPKKVLIPSGLTAATATAEDQIFIKNLAPDLQILEPLL